MLYLRNKSGYFALGLMLALLSGILLFGLHRWHTRTNAVSTITSSWIRVMDITITTRLAVCSLRCCQSATWIVFYGNARYYFQGGVWYRPQGRRFVIVAPPSYNRSVLPPYYATVMLGGVPYYYANEIYYTQTRGLCRRRATAGRSHSGTPGTPAPPSSDKLFLYPRKGRANSNRLKIVTSATAGL